MIPHGDTVINLHDRLGLIGRPACVDEAADRIVEWLTDPDAQTRAAAAEILGQLKPKRAAPALAPKSFSHRFKSR